MDMDYNQNEKDVSHYEYVVTKTNNTELKSAVFLSMKELHGWCSEEKASTLIDIILANKPQKIVEIGVWGGKSLIPMAYAVKANGSGAVYGIDPWSAQESADGMDGVNYEWWSQVDHELVYQSLVSSIKKFELENQIVLVRDTSENAPLISDIDILHIDGNHSDEASFIDVSKWVPCVKSGGLVIFDDVNWGTTGRAVSLLNEECIPLAEFRGDNIWGIWVKP
jgi:predicted O-methyltransferase YrrM